MKNNLYRRILFLGIILIMFSVKSFSQITVTRDSVCGPCVNLYASLLGDAPTSTGITADDGWSGTLSLGFTYNFYGNNYTSCLIGSNGAVSFNTSLAGSGFGWSITSVLLGNANVRNCVCGPWCDIYIPAGGTITYSSIGTAPYRKFMATWCRTRMYSCTSQWTTTQIILYETTNLAEVHIAHKTICSSWNGGYAIVGVQNAAGSAATAAPSRDYPTTWSATNEAWRFTPNSSSTAYTASSISFAPVPYASSTINWYDSASGAYLGAGTTINVCPTVPTTYKVTAAGCDDSTVSYFNVIPFTGSPVHITSIESVNPSVCGNCDGTIRLIGVNPNEIDSVFYSINGVAQPVIVDSAGADSTITLTGLCAATYDYFYVKVGNCPSDTVGPVTLVNPAWGITDTSSTNASCSACDGTITIYGLLPGRSTIVNYDFNGAAQTPVTATATGAGTITLSNLCPGTYDNIIAVLVSFIPGACVSNAVGPFYIVPPPLIPVRITAQTNPSECGACNGSITITGMAPGSVDTIFYKLNGVNQTPLVYSAGSDSSITMYSLCAGNYS
ncbi:MAG: hypothetical protein H7257_11590, partial [Taibaiella sp.]|nr:hypothetical protein [Taibaiella sp.]